MARETRKLSEVIPCDPGLIEGEIEVDGRLFVHTTRTTSAGDVTQSDYTIESDFGEAAYTSLTRSSYSVDWGSYAFRDGLAYRARIDRPVIQLHYQLDGGAHVDPGPIGKPFDVQAGDCNLVYMPPFSGSMGLSQDARGEVFGIMFGADYFAELAVRYPDLLGACHDRMVRNEPFWLTDRPLRMTLRMTQVIKQIKTLSQERATGSLFLEAMILELLALQFDQRATPADTAPTLSPADTDRMHAARTLLLSRLADPPSLAELSRAVGTNEFKLKQGFRTLFGTSPYAFLLDRRMELARTYLMDTDLTIAEIAFTVGYSDPAHLTHAFRKHSGMRPSDLRKTLS
ncbi:MAG: AraC family transcriptional regulator [Rhodothermales bacterium]